MGLYDPVKKMILWVKLTMRGETTNTSAVMRTLGKGGLSQVWLHKSDPLKPAHYEPLYKPDTLQPGYLCGDLPIRLVQSHPCIEAPRQSTKELQITKTQIKITTDMCLRPERSTAATWEAKKRKDKIYWPKRRLQWIKWDVTLWMYFIRVVYQCFWLHN